MKTNYIVVLVTAPDSKAAEKLAQGLVERRLAACVSVLPGATSLYYWEGKCRRDAETLLVIKTRTAAMAQVIAYVRENHGARLPEIIALPIAEGDKAYLDWVGANTIFGKPPEEESAPL